jgi:hypothetical protein
MKIGLRSTGEQVVSRSRPITGARVDHDRPGPPSQPGQCHPLPACRCGRRRSVQLRRLPAATLSRPASAELAGRKGRATDRSMGRDPAGSCRPRPVRAGRRSRCGCREILGKCASRCQCSQVLIPGRSAHGPSQTKRLGDAGGRTPLSSALRGATFVLAVPAPHPVLNSSQDRKFQTEASHRASGTHRFGLLELPLRQVAVTDRKEHLWVLAPAGRVVMPAHRSPPSSRASMPSALIRSS